MRPNASVKMQPVGKSLLRHLDCHMQPGLPRAGWNSPKRWRQQWQFNHPTAVCNAFGGSWRIKPFGSSDPVRRNPEQSTEISDLPCNLPPLEKQTNRTAIGTHSRFTRQDQSYAERPAEASKTFAREEAAPSGRRILGPIEYCRRVLQGPLL
jgi:hypothetical protein